MKKYLFTFGLILFISGMLLSRSYQWDTYVNGVHPASIYLEREAQALAGYWVMGTDTLGLEGQIKGEEIHLLEFYDGLWTASLQIDLQYGKPKIGYWFSRQKNETYWLSFGDSTHIPPAHKYDRSGIGEAILTSTISARDGAVHFVNPSEEWTFRQYVRTDSIAFFGSVPQQLGPMIQFGDPKRTAPIQPLTHQDYHRLVELFYPHFQLTNLDSFLLQRGHQFLSEMETQGRSLELRIPQEDRVRYRWHWNAYTYAEVYLWNKKMISLILHSKDYKNQNRIEAVHWHLRKDERIYLDTELKDPEKFRSFALSRVDGKYAAALHQEGLVLVSAFDAQKGIQRVFVPYKDMRKYYRFFSPLKRWRR